MYTVTIEKSGITGCGAYNTASSTVLVQSFTEKKDANKELRRLKKEEGYKSYAGHLCNFDLGTEVHTNY